MRHERLFGGLIVVVSEIKGPKCIDHGASSVESRVAINSSDILEITTVQSFEYEGMRVSMKCS